MEDEINVFMEMLGIAIAWNAAWILFYVALVMSYYYLRYQILTNPAQ